MTSKSRLACLPVALFLEIAFISFVSAFQGGEGTELSPYLISSCLELQEINNGLGSHYALTNNIDCSETREWNNGQGFVPLGYYDEEWQSFPFTGTLDGQNRTITGLYMNWDNVDGVYIGGLFGCTAVGFSAVRGRFNKIG